MLWVKIDVDGNLTIQADVPIEAYALRQWERQHKAGKATLKIETGQLFDMESLLQSVGKEVNEFKRWRQDRESKALLTDVKT